MESAEEGAFDDEGADEGQPEENPTLNAVLGAALTKQYIGHGSKEVDIDAALKMFGLPQPEHLQIKLWEGLASHDEAKWFNAYQTLEEFITSHKDLIDMDQATKAVANMLETWDSEWAWAYDKFAGASYGGSEATAGYLKAFASDVAHKEKPPAKQKGFKKLPSTLKFTEPNWDEVTIPDDMKYAGEEASEAYIAIRKHSWAKLAELEKELESMPAFRTQTDIRKLIQAFKLPKGIVKEEYSKKVWTRMRNAAISTIVWIEHTNTKRYREKAIAAGRKPYADKYFNTTNKAKRTKALRDDLQDRPGIDFFMQVLPYVRQFMRNEEEGKKVLAGKKDPPEQKTADKEAGQKDEREQKRLAELKALAAADKKALEKDLDYNVPMMKKRVQGLQDSTDEGKKAKKNLQYLMAFLEKPFPTQYTEDEWTTVSEDVKAVMLVLNKYYAELGMKGRDGDLSDDSFFRKKYKTGLSSENETNPAKLVLDSFKDYFKFETEKESWGKADKPPSPKKKPPSPKKKPEDPPKISKEIKISSTWLGYKHLDIIGQVKRGKPQLKMHLLRLVKIANDAGKLDPAMYDNTMRLFKGAPKGEFQGRPGDYAKLISRLKVVFKDAFEEAKRDTTKRKAKEAEEAKREKERNEAKKQAALADISKEGDKGEIGIPPPGELQKHDRVLIEDFLLGPDKPKRRMSGVPFTPENKMKYWANTIMQVSQVANLQVEPELYKIAMAFYSTYVGRSFHGTQNEKAKLAARIGEVEARLRELTKGYETDEAKKQKEADEARKQKEADEAKKQQEEKEPPKKISDKVAEPADFTTKYKADDLKVRLDIALYTFMTPPYVDDKKFMQRRGTKGFVFLDSQYWWKQQMQLGWKVQQQPFNTWFKGVAKRIEKQEYDTPMEAYEEFQRVLTQALHKWIDQKKGPQQIRFDNNLLDWSAGFQVKSLEQQTDYDFQADLLIWYKHPRSLPYEGLHLDYDAPLKRIMKELSDRFTGQEQPTVRFGTESLPDELPITDELLEEDVGDWPNEYNQIFGTNLCNAVKQIDNRDFMKHEMYSIWIRLLKRTGRTVKEIKDTDLKKFMRQVIQTKPFGNVATKNRETNKQTDEYKFYRYCQLNLGDKENNALWRVLAESVGKDDPPLLISNFHQRFRAYNAKHVKKRGTKRSLTSGVSKGHSKVRFGATTRIKRDPDPDIEITKHKFDTTNYIGMMNLLKEEVNQSKNGMFKSTGFVNEHLTFEGKDNRLRQTFDLIRDQDIIKASHLWGLTMEEYKILVKTLFKVPRGFEKVFVPKREKARGAVSKQALLTLQLMHRDLTALMVYRKLGGDSQIKKYQDVIDESYPQLKIKEDKPPKLQLPSHLPDLPGTPPSGKRKRDTSDLRKRSLKKAAAASPIKMPSLEKIPEPPARKRKREKANLAVYNKWLAKLPEEQRKQINALSSPMRKANLKQLIEMDSPGAITKAITKLAGPAPPTKPEPTKPTKLKVTLERPGMFSQLGSAFKTGFQAAQQLGSAIKTSITGSAKKATLKMPGEDDSKAAEPDPKSKLAKLPDTPDSLKAAPSPTVSPSFQLGSPGPSAPATPQRMNDLFRQLILARADHYDRSPSVARSWVSQRSFGSNRAMIDFPMEGRTIVRLRDIKRRMGAKVDLFSDASVLGFDRKHWESKLYKKFPIDFSEGFKQQLGPWIKTSHNKRKRELVFIAKKKATTHQVNSLIAIVESKLPPYHQVTSYIKRKVWEELYNINSLYDLHGYLVEELKLVHQVHMKLTW